MERWRLDGDVDLDFVRLLLVLDLERYGDLDFLSLLRTTTDLERVLLDLRADLERERWRDLDRDLLLDLLLLCPDLESDRGRRWAERDPERDLRLLSLPVSLGTMSGRSCDPPLADGSFPSRRSGSPAPGSASDSVELPVLSSSFLCCFFFFFFFLDEWRLRRLDFSSSSPARWETTSEGHGGIFKKEIIISLHKPQCERRGLKRFKVHRSAGLSVCPTAALVRC